jgi:hypothetical protein
MVAAVSGTVLGARGFLSAQTPPPILRYQTSCTINEARYVDGYVTNLSGDIYQVNGSVRFNFHMANTMSHPEVLLEANAFIPAGATILVARAQVLFQATPGEFCSFDVTQSIGKL